MVNAPNCPLCAAAVGDQDGPNLADRFIQVAVDHKVIILGGEGHFPFGIPEPHLHLPGGDITARIDPFRQIRHGRWKEKDQHSFCAGAADLKPALDIDDKQDIDTEVEVLFEGPFRSPIEMPMNLCMFEEQVLFYAGLEFRFRKKEVVFPMDFTRPWRACRRRNGWNQILVAGKQLLLYRRFPGARGA